MRDLMNFCRLADDAAMLEKMFCVGGSLNAHPPMRMNHGARHRRKRRSTHYDTVVFVRLGGQSEGNKAKY